MNDLASEFFFESIRRIIPGLALIIICFRQEAGQSFTFYNNFFASPIFFAVCIIALAWPVGVLIEAMTFFPFLLLFDGLRWAMPNCWPAKYLTWLYFVKMQRLKSNPHKAKENRYEREMRRQAYLLSMTKVMCRCMVVVCLFRLIMTCSWSISLLHSIWFQYPALAVCFAVTWFSNYWEDLFGAKREEYMKEHRLNSEKLDIQLPPRLAWLSRII
jgi:hypothetical protein